MSWFHRLFRTVARNNKLDKGIHKELLFHIDELTDANIAAGMSPEEGRRRAMQSSVRATHGQCATVADLSVIIGERPRNVTPLRGACTAGRKRPAGRHDATTR